MIIAIDGPAGSGKSTTAKLVAKKLGISYLDTGSMYRAVTFHFIEKGYDINRIDISLIIDLINLEIVDSSDKQLILLNGIDITDKLRSKDVSNLVSKISTFPLIRKKMVAIQRNLSKNKSIVIDGRDIGTIVFPNADYKFFLIASIKERAKRRFKELNEKNNLDFVEKEIADRDFLDSTRADSPLKRAKDAIIIDTTHLTISEQVNIILDKINITN